MRGLPGVPLRRRGGNRGGSAPLPRSGGPPAPGACTARPRTDRQRSGPARDGGPPDAAARDWSADAVPGRVTLQIHAEQAPNPASRVTLSRRRDRLGVPLPAVDWRLSELDHRTAQTMVREAAPGVHATRPGRGPARAVAHQRGLGAAHGRLPPPDGHDAVGHGSEDERRRRRVPRARCRRPVRRGRLRVPRGRLTRTRR